ncbi:MAG: hypothetical protein WA432_00145 [Candidatus Babeliaceae bacterium]
MIFEYKFFEFPDHEFISFEMPQSLEEICRWDFIIPVFNAQNEQKYDLCDDYIINILYGLRIFLNNVLAQQLQLHKSLQKDIGYMWNEYLQKRGRFIYEVNEYGRSWIGKRYMFCESSQDCKTDCATWLYQKGEQFYLEITPEYRWHFIDPKPEEASKYVTYDTFIQTYKPYVLKEITLSTIHQLLKKTEEVIEAVKKHDSKYFSPDLILP